MGQVAPLTGVQQHDFDPGIEPDGLFWTFKTSSDNVQVDSADFGAGASLTILRKPVLDYESLENALITHATKPIQANVSFLLSWFGNTGPAVANDPGRNRFRYEGINTHASLSWTAKSPSQNFEFASDDPSTSFETFAAVVREHNGSLY